MFDTQQQFFPTPYKIASQVWLKLAALGVSKSRVLDPSAGKGDLLTPGADYAGRYSCLDAYAVEIDPDLQVILREKGSR
jgi:predicted RNA methylase